MTNKAHINTNAHVRLGRRVTSPSRAGREKMARVAVCLAVIAPAAGLVAPAAPAASTALKAEAAASLKGMSGGVQAGDPMPGEGPWDPIGFSKLHENIQGSEHAGVVPSQQWMREAEIKHVTCEELNLRAPPTPSTRSSPWLCRLDGVEVHGGPRNSTQNSPRDVHPGTAA